MTPVTLEMLMREQAKMIGRLADMEKRIKNNADKAHAEIGSNIAKLGTKVTSLDTKVTSMGDQLDALDADVKKVNKSVGHLSDAWDKWQGAV